MISYSPAEAWTLGALCLLSSNRFPSFAPSGVGAEKVFTSDRSGLDVSGAANYAEPFDPNGDRLPGFQRLELLIQHRFAWGGMYLQTTLRMLNGYGLIDPFVWELRQTRDPRLKCRATFDPPPMFPLYPVVSLSVRF